LILTEIDVIFFKTWGTEHIKGNKTVPTKIIATRTEDGHK
jgi:hypothetical protein